MPFGFKHPTRTELNRVFDRINDIGLTDAVLFLDIATRVQEKISLKYKISLLNSFRLIQLASDYQLYKSDCIPNTLFLLRLGKYGKYHFNNDGIIGQFFRMEKRVMGCKSSNSGTYLTDSGKALISDIYKIFQSIASNRNKVFDLKYNFYKKENVAERRQLKPYYNLSELEQVILLRSYNRLNSEEKKKERDKLLKVYGIRKPDLLNEFRKYGKLLKAQIQ